MPRGDEGHIAMNDDTPRQNAGDIGGVEGVGRVSRVWPTLITRLFGIAGRYDRVAAWTILVVMPAVTFSACFHLGVLDPTNIGWTMFHDWGQHVLGWQAYRDVGWAFPLTQTPLLFTGVGAQTSLMDANPLMSILLKPFSPLLPDTFQFIGPWMLACVILQAVWGYVLIRPYASRRVVAALCGCAFLVWPALYERQGHDTLMAQWLILAALWAFLTPDEEDTSARRLGGPNASISRMVRMTAVMTLCVFVHAYLFLMVASFWGAMVLREGVLWLHSSRRIADLARLAVRSAVPVFCAIIAMFSVGFLPSSPGGAYGFGVYSMNLNAPINPQNASWSTFLPALPYERFQYEGFQYFGLGLLAVVAMAFVLAIFANRLRGTPMAGPVHPIPENRPGLVWLVPSCVFLTLLSVSTTVRFGDVTLVDIAMSDTIRHHALGVVRSSGRFFWPVAFVIMFAALSGIARRPARVAIPVLAGALVLQAIDVAPMAEDLKRRTHAATNRAFPAQISTDWRELVARAEHVVFIPPHAPNRHRGGFYEIVWAAMAEQTPVNTMYMARVRREQRQVMRDSEAAYYAGQRDPAALYVFTDPCAAQFLPTDQVHQLDDFALIAPAAGNQVVTDLPSDRAC